MHFFGPRVNLDVREYKELLRVDQHALAEDGESVRDRFVIRGVESRRLHVESDEKVGNVTQGLHHFSVPFERDVRRVPGVGDVSMRNFPYTKPVELTS